MFVMNLPQQVKMLVKSQVHLYCKALPGSIIILIQKRGKNSSYQAIIQWLRLIFSLKEMFAFKKGYF